MIPAFIASLTLRVSVVLAAALLCAALMRRTSAALRHAVLATAICSALAVPLFALALPQWHVTIPTRAIPTPRASASTSDAVRVQTTISVAPAVAAGNLPTADVGTAGPARLGSIFFWFWLVGTFLSLAALAAGLARLWLLTARARVVTSGTWVDALADLADARLNRVELRVSAHPSVLLTWGFARPCILLPSGAELWTAMRIRLVLEHEAEHIRRGDWILQVAAEALRAVAWFNPFAWAAADRLRIESERACDDAVLASGIAATDYAAQLVALARLLTVPAVRLPAPAMARPSSLERRVHAMLDSRITRRPHSRLIGITIAAVGIAFSLSVATLAQSKFATVTGTVRDQLGGTIPNVTVLLTQADSTARHELKSTASGTFEFVGLPPGNYSMIVESPGFKRVDTSMQLAAGQTLRQNVQLEVGELQETLTVRDGPPSSTPGRQRQFGPTSGTCSSEPNSGGIKPPKKIQDRKPEYPSSMTGTGTEGRVELQAIIGIDGTVRTMRTIEATNADFEQAAMDAVRQWRFTPTLLTCVPIEVTMNVLAVFRPEAAAPPPPPPPLPPLPPPPVR